MSDLALDELIVILSDETNDKQLVALAELVRRASRAEGLVEAVAKIATAPGNEYDFWAVEIAREALIAYRG